MSRDDVETVQHAFDALAEGGVEAMLPFVHEDFEMTTPPELASEPGAYEGHAGVRRWFDSFYDAMDEVHLDAEGIEDVGDELAVSFRITARGRSTGLEVVQEVAALCTVVDAKVKRIRYFATRDEAVEAAGNANVETLRRCIEAFNRRDLDTALAGFHPDVQWEPGPAAPDPTVYRGRSGVRRFWEGWIDSMDDFRIEITDSIQADDRVLLVIRAVGTGKGSGAPVEAELFQAYEFRDGKVLRARIFRERSDAVEAVGLRE